MSGFCPRTSHVGQSTVEEALTKRTEEQTQRMRRKWIQISSNRVQYAVDALVDDGQLRPELADAVADLLHEEMYETVQLKVDVKDGELSEAEAMAQWRLLRSEYKEALFELVGEEVGQIVDQRVNGPATK